MFNKSTNNGCCFAFRKKYIILIFVILLVLGCSVKYNESIYTVIYIFGVHSTKANQIFRLVMWAVMCLMLLFYIISYRMIVRRFDKLLATNNVENSIKLITKYFSQNEALFWSQQLLLYFYMEDTDKIDKFYLANQYKRNRATMCQFYLCVLYFSAGICGLEFIDRTLAIWPQKKKYRNGGFILYAIRAYMLGDFELARNICTKISNRYNCSAINETIEIINGNK